MYVALLILLKFLVRNFAPHFPVHTCTLELPNVSTILYCHTSVF